MGWKTLVLGDGGLITGIDVANTGAAYNVVCKTDVAGAYSWRDNIFHQICNQDVFSGVSAYGPLAGGVWEICAAPTEPDRIYMIWDGLTNVGGNYAVYTSTTGGIGTSSVTNTGLTFRTQGYTYWFTDISNAGTSRMGIKKMVVDPANALVCYVGIPKGCIPTGAYAGQSPGVFRTLDGGTTWTLVSALPTPCNQPGYCGMVMDPNYPTAGTSTTTLTGVTVTKRIIIPVCGRGIWESLDGGATWTQIADDPQTTSVSYTTSTNDSMIVVQAACMGINEMIGVTATSGPGGISYPAEFVLRADPTTGTTAVPASPRGYYNQYMQGVGFEFYLLCPTAGTYNFTVKYSSGGLSHRSGNSNYTDALVKATAAAAIISNSGGVGGATFTEGGAITGTFAIGQNICTFLGGLYGNHLRIRSLISSGPNVWQLTGYMNTANGDPRSGFFWGSITPAYSINVFAVNHVDMVNPWGDWLPVQPIVPYATPGYVVTSATALIITMHGMYGPGAPDAGYTQMSYDTDTGFWTEISSSPQAAGAYAPQISATPPYYITDAIKQGTGTIVLDPNGYQYFRTDLSWQDQPCDVIHGMLDASGTYWVINGPHTQSNPTAPQPIGPGGTYRYKSGTWDRIDGSYTMRTVTYGMPYGWPSDNIFGNFFVDPRVGYEGRVHFCFDNVTHAIYCMNGNDALTSLVWADDGNQSDSVPTTTVTSSVGWLHQGTITPSFYRTPATGASVDPITGEVWFAAGYGVIKLLNSYNYALGSYVWVAENNAQGVEEMIVQSFLSPPGATAIPKFVLCGVQDECCMQAGLDTGATAIVQELGADSHCWGIDYASDNPAFVVALVLNQGSADNSGFSTNYGYQGTWHNFNRSNPINVGSSGTGGSVACASVGADGLIAGNATAKIMAVTGVNVQKVNYTLNNGTTAWLPCSWAPSDNYGQIPPYQGSSSQMVAADRVNIGTYYLYSPSNGIYRSTDFGVTGSLVNTLKPTTPDQFANILSTPGYAGHVWLAGNFVIGPLYFSSDGGTTFASINANVTCYFLGMGKAHPSSSYPTLFIGGTVTGAAALGNAGTGGFWRSIDQGAHWTLYGEYADYISAGGYWSGPMFLRGDWNVFGTTYSGWGQAGAIAFEIDEPSVGDVDSLRTLMSTYASFKTAPRKIPQV